MIEVTTKSSVPQEVEEVVDLVLLLDSNSTVLSNWLVAKSLNKSTAMYDNWIADTIATTHRYGFHSLGMEAKSVLEDMQDQWKSMGNVRRLYADATSFVNTYGPLPTKDRIAHSTGCEASATNDAN